MLPEVVFVVVAGVVPERAEPEPVVEPVVEPATAPEVPLVPVAPLEPAELELVEVVVVDPDEPLADALEAIAICLKEIN